MKADIQPISGTASKVAQLLDVHPNTVHLWAKEPGAPRPYKTNPNRWLLDDWRKWAEARRRVSPDGRQSLMVSGCSR